MSGAKRVLVVDDEALIRVMVREVLEHAGYYVATLDRPKRVRAAVSAHEPDLILLDLMMPEVGGLEALAALAGHTAAPVILMSAYLTSARGQQVAAEAQALGVRTFLPKPFDIETLLQTVASALHEEAA